MLERISRTLQEYVVLPGYISGGFRPEVDLLSYLTHYRSGEEKSSMTVNIPILSAAMQCVTGPRMCIDLARLGGLGVIPRSQTIENQTQMISDVKGYKAGFVTPETVSPEVSLEDVQRRMKRTGYSKFPVIDTQGKLLGIITDNDFDPELHLNTGLTVRNRMIPTEKLDAVYSDEISDIKEANRRLREGHHSVLPIIDRDGKLLYLVFKKDWETHERYPDELLDDEKRYKVGAAIDTLDYKNRVPSLIEAGVDVLFIDSSHGHTEYQEETLKYVKENYPDIPIIGGNVVTSDGFRFLAERGVNAVKVGMSSGYGCITKEQIGVGRGQATAVREVADERNLYFEKTGIYVPIISDGGVIVAKDILTALALGADSVMVGSYVSGCDESPPPVQEIEVEIEGLGSMMVKAKPYWGEASPRAKEWMEGRYTHSSFPEGVETWVAYYGPLDSHLETALHKIRDGMRKAGCESIRELHEKVENGQVRLELLSQSSVRESRARYVGRSRF